MLPRNKRLKTTARNLRKNMTAEEKRLWYDFLKKLPMTVKRQYNIENYIVDFYIAEKRLVIEVDGAQHYEIENKEADEKRSEKLAAWGINVLRYSNRDIRRNFNSVAEDILRKLGISAEDLKKEE